MRDELQQPKSRIFHKAQAGYGMALLLVFLLSSILVASSSSLILSSSAVGYTGSTAQDDSTARQLAEEALDAAKTDILTKLASGTTVDTSYRYPGSGTNSITVPTHPGSSTTSSKGSYYVNCDLCSRLYLCFKSVCDGWSELGSRVQIGPVI